MTNNSTPFGGVTVTAAQATLDPPAPPIPGQTASVTPVSGTVLVTLPGSKTPIPLTTGASIPLGSVVDATKGIVQLTTAPDLSGTLQSGDFSLGAFLVKQTPKFTELRLVGGKFSKCRRHGRRIRSSRVVYRRLFGRAHGPFRTRGRTSFTSIRGTGWLTQDTCGGTRTSVTEGTVAVRDLVRHVTVIVRTGEHYLAAIAKKP